MNTNRDKVGASWPFQEAARIVVAGEPAVFESGFGPSGRPHIGTFAEVARTIMVRNAFHELHPGVATKLYAFCDDMDGLRKVPGNMPNPEMLRENLGRPLSRIPDPFGTDPSYSDHMERELQEFLARFGFDFELKSSTLEYAAGAFNPGLKRVLERYDEIRAVVLPTLGEENRERWSPFIPICENCGKLYTTVVTGVDPAAETLGYECTGSHGEGQNQVTGCGRRGAVSIYDGKVKVGWKVDWALRWFTYNVRYEMYGKDLIDSARLSSRIVKIMGGIPPAGMVYELFLDEAGRKISKSVGEGLTVDSWMTYAPIESLLYYLFQNPKKQRRLYFDVIPKSVDDYLDELRKYPSLDDQSRYDSPIWNIETSIHRMNIKEISKIMKKDEGKLSFENVDLKDPVQVNELLMSINKLRNSIVSYSSTVTYSMVLNLISAIGVASSHLLLEYLRRYDPNVEKDRELFVVMILSAVRYFQDFIAPNKKYRPATEDERKWFADLRGRLAAYAGTDENELQAMVFDVAKAAGADARLVFKAIYEVLLGQERGPRFGTFAKLVGRERVAQLLDRALSP